MEMKEIDQYIKEQETVLLNNMTNISQIFRVNLNRFEKIVKLSKIKNVSGYAEIQNMLANRKIILTTSAVGVYLARARKEALKQNCEQLTIETNVSSILDDIDEYLKLQNKNIENNCTNVAEIFRKNISRFEEVLDISKRRKVSGYLEIQKLLANRNINISVNAVGLYLSKTRRELEKKWIKDLDEFDIFKDD